MPVPDVGLFCRLLLDEPLNEPCPHGEALLCPVVDVPEFELSVPELLSAFPPGIVVPEEGLSGEEGLLLTPLPVPAPDVLEPEDEPPLCAEAKVEPATNRAAASKRTDFFMETSCCTWVPTRH